MKTTFSRFVHGVEGDTLERAFLRWQTQLLGPTQDRARAKNPKTQHNTRTFQQRFRSARGGRERLQALLFAKGPDVLAL